MANTSATGGYLTSNITLDDDALQDFMHSVVSGITGLPGELVRPSGQAEPLARPGIDVDWCSFYVTNHITENGHAYVSVNQDGAGSKMRRHENFDLIIKMYGPNCGRYVSALRDGLEIPQNREQLYLAGMAYTDAGQIVKIPEFVDELWYARADITLTFRREMGRGYAVLSFLSAAGLIKTETLTVDWAVGPEV